MLSPFGSHEAGLCWILKSALIVTSGRFLSCGSLACCAQPFVLLPFDVSFLSGCGHYVVFMNSLGASVLPFEEKR